MILERAIFAIKPGEAKAFEAAFAKAGPLIRAAKGLRCKADMRSRDPKTPTSYIRCWCVDQESVWTTIS